MHKIGPLCGWAPKTPSLLPVCSWIASVFQFRGNPDCTKNCVLRKQPTQKLLPLKQITYDTVLTRHGNIRPQSEVLLQRRTSQIQISVTQPSFFIGCFGTGCNLRAQYVCCHWCKKSIDFHSFILVVEVAHTYSAPPASPLQPQHSLSA